MGDTGVLATILRRYKMTFTVCEDKKSCLHITKIIVRQSNVIFRPNPALTVKIIFSLDYTSLGCLERISSGYQEDILEQFEKSKMAAKMAAIAKKKLIAQGYPLDIRRIFDLEILNM